MQTDHAEPVKLASDSDSEKKPKNHLESSIKELRNSLQKHYLINSLLIKYFSMREQMEKTLRESELRFHLLAENATDIISRHSPDGIYLYTSPSCKTLLGYKQEELTGRSIYKLLHHDDIKKFKTLFTRRKENGKTQTVVYRIRRKEGDYRWFESTLRLIRDEENKIIREIQLASRDVNDHILDKKARLRGQQLAHVYRLSTMEEMASGMAHEISQPLAAVVNYTQGCVRHLQNNQYDKTQLMEIMKKAVQQAERAGEIVHRLKNFFCKGQISKTLCKMNSIIRETVSLIRRELNHAKIKIEFEFTKEIILLSADKIQLQQVMLNLIQNAMEAMQNSDLPEKRIHIQTKLFEKTKIEVTIKDSGPGFSKDIVNKVFEPFFTTKTQGRGMGLAICRSIIEAHGGQFSIHPKTTQSHWIRFTLPIHHYKEMNT